MGRLTATPKPGKEGQGVLVVTGPEGLSVCTDNSDNSKLNSSCCLEGRGDLQEKSFLGSFWLWGSSKREDWMNWEDLQ